MTRLAQSLALAWRDLCSLRAYFLLTAIVALFYRACSLVRLHYRTEPRDGFFHQLRYLIESLLSYLPSSWW